MRRFPYFLIAGSLIVAACGSSGATSGPTAAQQTTLVTATPAPTATIAAPTPSPTPALSPTPTAWPTGTPGALAYMKAYEDDIVAGNCSTAWTMLDAVWQANWKSEADFTTSCNAQPDSDGTAYTLTANPSNTMGLADWLSGMAYPGPTPSVDMAHAVLVEVDWTKLQGNNAGWDMWVCNPVSGGWEIFQVR